MRGGRVLVFVFFPLQKEESKKKENPHKSHSHIHRTLNPKKDGICNTVEMKKTKYSSVKIGRL